MALRPVSEDDPAKTGTLSHIDAAGKETKLGDFALEPDVEKGEIPQRVVDELVHVRTIAKDYAQSYSDAVKTQGEKHGIPVGALKRYIAALMDDQVQSVQIELDALQGLLSQEGK